MWHSGNIKSEVVRQISLSCLTFALVIPPVSDAATDSADTAGVAIFAAIGTAARAAVGIGSVFKTSDAGIGATIGTVIGAAVSTAIDAAGTVALENLSAAIEATI